MKNAFFMKNKKNVFCGKNQKMYLFYTAENLKSFKQLKITKSNNIQVFALPNVEFFHVRKFLQKCFLTEFDSIVQSHSWYFS